MGSSPLLHGSVVLQFKGTGAALSGGYVLRLLPCRAESRSTSRRRGAPSVGEFEFARRGAVLLGRPDLQLEIGRIELPVPGAPYIAPRLTRHLVDCNRLHQ